MANRTKIEKLEELIRDTIEGELIEQHASPLLPPGENYGSVMYKVDFKVKRADGEIKEYHAVAKCTPLNTVTQEIFNTQETFKSEIAWYTTVIPTLKKFAKDQGLERELDFFQRFYGARISLDPKSEKVDLDGVILTENLKYLGYKNVDRHQGFDAPTTLRILRDLATFHAVPLALRIKEPELFNRNILSHCFESGSIGDEMQEKLENDLLEIFNHIPELKSYMERISKNIEIKKAYGSREVREPWVSILHKDMWCNNIMVTGGEKSKNIILDLQMATVASPVGDVIFFLLTSVRYETITQQLDEFIKFYYDEFIRNLECLQIDPTPYNYVGYLKEIDLAMRTCEFTHVLSHNQMALQDKGISSIDSADANYTFEKMTDVKVVPNEQQIKKFRWLTLEAIRRNWI